MANNPSSAANTANMYPHSGIYGHVLPSGYAHFADSLQEQINRGGSSYITTFPSGWDENVDDKERYVNLDPLQDSNGVYFPVYTSGMSFVSGVSSGMSDLFISDTFSNSRKSYSEASSGNLQFDISGFKNQGNVLARSGESFMFTNSFATTSAGGFNLNDTAEPFRYQVKYSGVSDIFNSSIYKYKIAVSGIASGVYDYPLAPTSPDLSSPPIDSEPPSGPSEPPSEPPSGPAPGTLAAAGDIIWNEPIVTGNDGT